MATCVTGEVWKPQAKIMIKRFCYFIFWSISSGKSTLTHAKQRSKIWHQVLHLMMPLLSIQGRIFRYLRAILFDKTVTIQLDIGNKISLSCAKLRVTLDENGKRCWITEDIPQWKWLNGQVSLFRLKSVDQLTKLSMLFSGLWRWLSTTSSQFTILWWPPRWVVPWWPKQ